MIMFQDLNDHLAQHTYLVGEMTSVADVSVFLAITSVVQALSIAEKERLVHLSRWYDHIQHRLGLRPKTEFVNFSTLRLSAFERLSIGH